MNKELLKTDNVAGTYSSFYLLTSILLPLLFSRIPLCFFLLLSSFSYFFTSSSSSSSPLLVWVMMLLYFGTMVVLSVFETVGTPLTMDEYAWDPQTVRSLIGLISVFILSSCTLFTVSLQIKHILFPCSCCCCCRFILLLLLLLTHSLSFSPSLSPRRILATVWLLVASA